jgi:hypothetical protein
LLLVSFTSTCQPVSLHHATVTGRWFNGAKVLRFKF